MSEVDTPFPVYPPLGTHTTDPANRNQYSALPLLSLIWVFHAART